MTTDRRADLKFDGIDLIDLIKGRMWLVKLKE